MAKGKKDSGDKQAVTIKLQIPAGEAKADPPIGPALGQHGVNIGEFISRFNSETANQEKGITLPVIITIQPDRSFDFIIRKPPAAVLIKKALGLDKGSGSPLANKVGKLSSAQLQEIAEVKIDELNTNDINQAMQIIAGTARSMGVEVEVANG